MKQSTRNLMVGIILIVLAAGIFYWGISSDLQASAGPDEDPMRVVGQVGGGVGGIGVVFVILGLIGRGRGK